MKSSLLIAIATSLALVPAMADEKDKEAHKHDHDHDHAHVAGPNQGRILHEVHPHAELFVTKDRKLQITFIDHDGKAIAPDKQTVSVICGKRTSPTRMTFAKKENAFLSEQSLPEGEMIPTVLQIKTAPDAKTTTIRLNLNLEDCPTCDHLEYACTCDHHHGDENK